MDSQCVSGRHVSRPQLERLTPSEQRQDHARSARHAVVAHFAGNQGRESISYRSSFMNRRRLLAFSPLIFTACENLPSAPKEAVTALPQGVRVTLITAHSVGTNRAPQGVADYFTYDGKLVAYASFTWTQLDSAWGKQRISFHWFNGDRLIRKYDVDINFGTPPHHVWASSQPTALGAGNCRVELYWNGQKLAERAFKVLDASGPPPIPVGPAT